MISLKRNSKYELAKATGLRSRNIYEPGSAKDFKISRGKFSNFLTCERCFYLDRVKGVVTPSLPGWSLNAATDVLLKKEFDICRKNKIPHRLFKDYGLEHIVPLDHPDLDKWRDSLRAGLMERHRDTNIILTGGVDDIWFNTNTEELIVVDYKSQSNKRPVEPWSYLSSIYHEGYKRQLDFYAYLLKEMDFLVAETGYFLVCNGNKEADGFFGKMEFSETLIPYDTKTDWIKSEVDRMYHLMNQRELPAVNPYCENCAYAARRAEFECE